MSSILIADDEEGVREFLTDALVGDGHQVTPVPDGETALRTLRSGAFDLLITDLKMPGALDGAELLRAARRERPDMEVMVLTAHGTVATAVEAMKLGAVDYLEKPVESPARLRQLVWRALERHSQRVARAGEPGGDPLEQLSRGVQHALGSEYAVEGVVGRGGYAVVFRVHDRRLDRLLAAKALLPEHAAVPAVAERFRREAQVSARLNHPNIVPVYFVAGPGDTPCFVMPLVSGGSLAARLAREHRFDPPVTLGIAGDVARALDYAHQSGVIHRDVKPDNILLDAGSGRALLTDFGIAKAVASDGNATGPGIVLGTPQYVSPERASGERNLDARSDVYSFAIVVYEMLAGRPPFDGKDTEHVVLQHLSAPVPSLAARRGDLPRAVDRVFARALAKHPADRYALAADFVEALSLACGLEPTGR